MKKFLILLVLLTFAIPAYAATIYKWVDEKGVVNFTDDINNVPLSYRDRVEVEIKEDVQKPATSVPPQAPLEKKEEVRTDIYGRNEAWWREKVHFWKEKLKEATGNYENANNKFVKKAEELSQTNFYGRSRSQSKWDVMDLNRLNEEKKKYEAQVAEANEMLSKLSKEAKETKADPAWLE